eukprot:9670-Rhodomonas_salina.2
MVRARLARLVATATVDDSSEMRKNPELYSAMTDGSGNLGGFMPSEKPEVLAPVGGWAQLHAAVNNGAGLLLSLAVLPGGKADIHLGRADAVYFGVNAFNARKRASGFDPEEELPEVMDFLHKHGVRYPA